MANAKMGQNIDPDEMFRYFSWAWFAVNAVMYTVYVFWMKVFKKAPFILSKRNEWPRHLVLLWHSSFLLILFCGYCIYTVVVPYLPFWMTNTFVIGGGRRSFADFAWLTAMFVLGYYERKWLYRERKTSGEESENLEE